MLGIWQSWYAWLDCKRRASSRFGWCVNSQELFSRLQSSGCLQIGGQTGGIGDPSGKSVDRPLMDRLVLEENTQGLRSDLERFIRNSEAAVQISGGNGAVQPGEIVNNATHYANMTINDFFVSVGRHMRISSMLARESVASRLQREDGLGLSLTEFAYQAFQAHDFVCLHKQHHAVLQVGGSDQWGNICAGIDLVHKVCGASVHGLTVPLITTPSGEKFGKSAGNAVWLDPAKTSHVSSDVVSFLRYRAHFCRAVRVLSIFPEPARRHGAAAAGALDPLERRRDRRGS